MKQFNDSGHWGKQKPANSHRLFRVALCCTLTVFALLLLPANGLAQAEKPAKITGKVTSTSGTPLAGVTITVEGTYRGAFTTVDGAYNIDAKPGEKLKFSFIGYNEVIIEVEDKTIIDVSLVEQAEEINTVTVVAFGQQKKESVVGSITTVRPSELKAPTSNLTTALAGRIAGLVAFQSSGEPGRDNADFFVRGVTSFGYSNNPLILVDGIEMSSSELARLQVDDISSFSLMKDATATSLYGARGANGVILVTTKEGAEGRARINFRVETALSGPTDKVDLADPIAYMNLYNEAIRTRNPAESERYNWERINNTALHRNPLVNPATDWYKMLLKDNTWNTRYNLNVSGGGKVARYYVAATLKMDELFYTVNGVPIDEDKSYDYENRYELTTVPGDQLYYMQPGATTVKLHLYREPRFYGTLGVDGGWWFGLGRQDDRNQWKLNFVLGSQEGGRIGSDRYSSTGLYIKKWTPWESSFSGTSLVHKGFNFPLIRLADMYLLYAEALNESLSAPTEEVWRYVNMVRDRAGLDPVEIAWPAHSTNPEKYTRKEGMRDIIRQERNIELSFEGHRFWDIRRWNLAIKFFNEPQQGWNADYGRTKEELYQIITFPRKTYGLKDVLWPIITVELTKNANLVQNPGWEN